MSVAYQRGSLLYQQKRYAMAADEFRKELSQNPTSASAMSMLALSLNYCKKNKEAMELARTAVTTEPDDGFAHYALACVIAGPPLELPEKRAFRLYWAGGRLIAYRRRLRKARPVAMEAIRLNPRSPNFNALMSAIEFDLQRPKKALYWAEQGLAADAEHVRCSTLRARALAKLGRAHEARQAIQEALELAPESASTHAAGGWTHLQTGNADQAIEHFTESMRLNPEDAGVRKGLQAARRSATTKSLLLVSVLCSVGWAAVNIEEYRQDKANAGMHLLLVVFAAVLFFRAARRLYRRRKRREPRRQPNSL